MSADGGMGASGGGERRSDQIKLDEVLGFCRMLLDFRSVERILPFPGGEENENDAEHSYMLTMLAWYLASRAELGLDLNMVLRYALVHDLVEVYAGDTYIYDAASKRTKARREAAAARRLQQQYPDFGELHELIAAYERRADAECRFVYALDKIVPVIIVYLGDGQAWHDYNITLPMLRQTKDPQVSQSQPLLDLWEELTAKLASQPEMFPKL